MKAACFLILKVLFERNEQEYAENWSEAGRSNTEVMKRPKFYLDRKEEYEIRY